MITTIKLDSEYQSQFEIDNKENYLFGINKFNILIGKNNSGKSRFLRSLIPINKNILYFDDTSYNEILNYLNKEYLQHFGVIIRTNQSYGLKFKNKEYTILEAKIRESKLDAIENLYLLYKYYDNINVEYFEESYNKRINLGTTISAPYIAISKSIYSLLQRLKNPLQDLNTIYIPVIRGLRPIDFSDGSLFKNTDFYKKRTEHDYFKKADTKYVYTGLTMYDDVIELLLGDEDDRSLIQDFESFISKHIFNIKVTLIPRHKDDVLHIKIGSDKQFPIYTLGDGLQTILTILFPIFKSKTKNNFVLIEEPETHLHPQFQNLLFKALDSFANTTFFITTHSFLNINIQNTSIFSVKKENEISKISLLNSKHDKLKLLYDLGYKQSDLFITNFLIWVEGPSDRIYLNYFLSKLDPSLKEGIHYNILYYGGDNYNSLFGDDIESSLELLRSVNNNIAIIMDSDKSKKSDSLPTKKKQINDLFRSQKLFCWITKAREIENYIPLEIFKEAISNFLKIQNVELVDGLYIDRLKIKSESKKSLPRILIRMPDEMYTFIGKSKGRIDQIENEKLKIWIQTAIDESRNTYCNLNKTKVAREVVKLLPEVDSVELQLKLRSLIRKIKEANT